MFSEDCISIPRQDNKPKSNNILYFISTVDNYNVYTDPYLDVNTNLIKLIEILEECKKLKDLGEDVTFNFISSWFVYGKTNEIPATEETVCNPTGFYSITKHTAERLLISYCETFNINYKIFRLTNIIGKGDKKVSKKKNALQYMINCLKENKDVYLYNGGNITRDYMHVDDCCRAIKICIDEAENKSIINISNCQPVLIGDIIQYAKNKLNSKSKSISIEPTDFHKTVQIENMYLDNSRLLRFGYTPSIDTYAAIDKLLQ